MLPRGSRSAKLAGIEIYDVVYLFRCSEASLKAHDTKTGWQFGVPLGSDLGVAVGHTLAASSHTLRLLSIAERAMNPEDRKRQEAIW